MRSVASSPTVPLHQPLPIGLQYKLLPLLVVVGLASNVVHAQTQQPATITPFQITDATNPYLQNFDTTEALPYGPGLANSGTTNVNTPPGWGFHEDGTGTADDGTYNANNGGNDNGNTYSYGTTGSNERAFGSLATGSLATIHLGGIFTNNTGSTITAITITFTGEQWRQGALTTDTLAFSYNTNASLLAGNLTAGTWTNFSGLNFTSPNTTSTTNVALDGNADGNRSVITATILGLSIPEGQSFGIRWTDTDIASVGDDGLAIDDLTMTVVPEPSTYAAGLLALAAIAFTRRRKSAG